MKDSVREDVVPAKAGTQWLLLERRWIPAGACPRVYLSGAGMKPALSVRGG